MKRILPILVVAWLLPVAAIANDAAVYVVHGINGTDLGLPEAATVDVSVDGACAITGFEFKDIVGPIMLSAGTHTIVVSLSDGGCTGDAVIDVDVDFAGHRMLTVVAHLDASGSPTASLFFNNQGSTAETFGKILVRHVAVAPSVDVTFRPAGSPDNPGIVFANLQNGWQRTASVSAGNWRGRIFPNGNTALLVGPVPVPVAADEILVIYAIGSLENGTFDLLVQTLPLLPRP